MSTFLPQIYHELNLLMLWYDANIYSFKGINKKYWFKYLNIGLKEVVIKNET